MAKFRFVCLLLLFAAGCTLAKVDVNVVSERTALENQVLGSYNSLNKDLLLVSSVRGVDPMGRVETPPRHSGEYKHAEEAMQTLAFHADDVDRFKRLGWVGENLDGLLTAFPLQKENVPEDLKDFAARYQSGEFETVLTQVNAARETVMGRVIEVNENFTAEDYPKIRKVFAKIHRDTALPGERIQLEDGTWSAKP